MKYYFLKKETGHVVGYTEVEQGENCIMLDNPSQDLIDNFIMYKIVEDEIIKMTEKEFKELYPNYGVEPEQLPTAQDKINAMLLAKIALLEAKEITKNV